MSQVTRDPLLRTKIDSIFLGIPSSPDFGDLASSICFEIAKKLNILPPKLAETVISNIDFSEVSLVESAKAVGGYINFYADNSELSKLTLESVRLLSRSYGYVAVSSPMKVIVEHTSVNPVGPIHVGTARNSILGDSLSRILKARGHNVTTHFYVDDVGRQIAVLAYAYDILKRPIPKGKADHWIGLVYAMTSCIIEIEKLKKNLKELEGNDTQLEQANKTRLDLDSWVSAAADLQERDNALFEVLRNGIKMKSGDPEESIAKNIQLYERNDSEIKKLVRDVIELCIDGFKETYRRVCVSWDSWDWESDLVWSGAVADVLNRLGGSSYCIVKDGVLAFDAEVAAKAMQLKRHFGISEEHEIPPLVLARSDGTTLYSSRDIAYSLWKLRHADKVINVIGVEQTLAQLQIRIAISLLASVEKAESLVHYAYELVTLPGYKMSKRRGIYVTLDEILDEAIKLAYKEVDKRSPSLNSELKNKISEAVGIGAVKYALIDVVSTKQVVFTWDKVLNFETNSAPFIQYAYARACNILEKAEKCDESPDYALLKETVERGLVRKIAIFPETFISAADGLTPSLLTDFAYDLAAKFNSFYASLPVLKANPKGLKDARLTMVDAVRLTLRNILDLLGIEPLERM